MFCGLVIIIKNFNSIWRPWSPILISQLFQHGFFRFLAAAFLLQGCYGRDDTLLDPLTSSGGFFHNVTGKSTLLTA